MRRYNGLRLPLKIITLKRGKFDFPLNFCYNNYILKRKEINKIMKTYLISSKNKFSEYHPIEIVQEINKKNFEKHFYFLYSELKGRGGKVVNPIMEKALNDFLRNGEIIKGENSLRYEIVDSISSSIYWNGKEWTTIHPGYLSYNALTFLVRLNEAYLNKYSEDERYKILTIMANDLTKE